MALAQSNPDISSYCAIPWLLTCIQSNSDLNSTLFNNLPMFARCRHLSSFHYHPIPSNILLFCQSQLAYGTLSE